MFGVSTSWRARLIENGGDLIRAMTGIGVEGVELEYRLSPATFSQAVAACRKRELPIRSIHAVVPADPRKEKVYDTQLYSLTAGDEGERREAVDEVAATIRLAASLEVPVIVLHCGKVPMPRVTGQLHLLHDAGKIGTDEAMRITNVLKIERLARRGNSFERLLTSLDEIAATADRHGVQVGIENRYHMTEYPNFEELAIIFNRFAGGPLRYWHDTGHAQVQENLGVSPHEAYLREFGHLLAGVHIHDVAGYTDHYAPPMGDREGVDFAMVARYLKPSTIKILELRDTVTDREAAAGVAWMKETFGAGVAQGS